MKLNYLVVMPHFAFNDGDGYIFPLGIPYISASLKNGGFRVTSLNLNHCVDDYKTLKQIIIDNDIDVVFTGGLSGQFNTVKSIVDVVSLWKVLS